MIIRVISRGDYSVVKMRVVFGMTRVHSEKVVVHRISHLKDSNRRAIRAIRVIRVIRVIRSRIVSEP